MPTQPQDLYNSRFAINDNAYFTVVVNTTLEDLPGSTITLDGRAMPCHFRLLDCDAFLNSHKLSVVEFHGIDLKDLSYAAISYPWRDLQLPRGESPPKGGFSVKEADRLSVDVLRTACLAARQHGASFLWVDRLCLMQTNKLDKNWQIRWMYQIYRHCNPCLIFPGGLVRLAQLTERIIWTDRAWTLQEAAANTDRDTTRCIFSITHASIRDFVQGIADQYRPAAVAYLRNYKDAFPYDVIEAGRSASCKLLDLLLAINFSLSEFEETDPTGYLQDGAHPLQIISAPAGALLSKSLVGNGVVNHQFTWMSAFTRTSSRPVDMVFKFHGHVGGGPPCGRLPPT